MSESNGGGEVEGTAIKVRVPKRVLHFSDGVMEEYSDDEDVVDRATTAPTESSALIDPKHMNWGPWFMYKALQSGTSALAICDYIGESLANFLGITTPKYQYELDEFERMEKERQEREAKAEGWSLPAMRKSGSAAADDAPITTEQPSSAI